MRWLVAAWESTPCVRLEPVSRFAESTQRNSSTSQMLARAIAECDDWMNHRSGAVFMDCLGEGGRACVFTLHESVCSGPLERAATCFSAAVDGEVLAQLPANFKEVLAAVRKACQQATINYCS